MEDQLFSIVFGGLIGLTIFMIVLRWALGINQIQKNQDAILMALILLLRRQGATEDDIEMIRNIRR